MSTGYRVRLTTFRFLGGPKPVFEVTLPDGETLIAETAWGARRIIRKAKQAQAMDRQEQEGAAEVRLQAP